MMRAAGHDKSSVRGLCLCVLLPPQDPPSAQAPSVGLAAGMIPAQGLAKPASGAAQASVALAAAAEAGGMGLGVEGALYGPPATGAAPAAGVHPGDMGAIGNLSMPQHEADMRGGPEAMVQEGAQQSSLVGHHARRMSATLTLGEVPGMPHACGAASISTPVCACMALGSMHGLHRLHDPLSTRRHTPLGRSDCC